MIRSYRVSVAGLWANRRTLRPSMRVRRAARAHEEEPQGAPKEEGVGPLARARLGLGDGVQLEATHEAVREDVELLPRAVGRVVVGSTTSRANSPLSSAKVFPCAPRPQAKAHRAASPGGMFVATAEYS